MKLFKDNLYIIVLITFFSVVPIFSYAAMTGGAPVNKLENPISVNSINDFIRVLLEGAIKVGIPIVALALIYSGFLFVKAQGKPEEITKAKEAFLYTLIGAAILLGAWAIATLIVDTVKSLSLAT